MATTNISVSAAFTPTNGTQPTLTYPPAGYQQTIDLLSAYALYETASAPFGSAATVPVPATATTGATNVVLQNTDAINYLLVAVPNVAANATLHFVLAPGGFLALPQSVASLGGGSLATSPANLSAVTVRSVLNTGLASSAACAYSVFSTTY